MKIKVNSSMKNLDSPGVSRSKELCLVRSQGEWWSHAVSSEEDGQFEEAVFSVQYQHPRECKIFLSLLGNL